MMIFNDFSFQAFMMYVIKLQNQARFLTNNYIEFCYCGLP
jgi:hypothetical protein